MKSRSSSEQLTCKLCLTCKYTISVLNGIQPLSNHLMTSEAAQPHVVSWRKWQKIPPRPTSRQPKRPQKPTTSGPRDNLDMTGTPSSNRSDCPLPCKMPIQPTRPQASPLLTAECIWFKCDLYLQFIPPINLWKICIDLRPFSKYFNEPFSRTLRSPRSNNLQIQNDENSK